MNTIDNTSADAPVVSNFINGNWCIPNVDTFFPVHNPSKGTVIARTPLSTNETLNEAVEAAQKAFRHWSAVPVLKRVSYLFDYRQRLETRFDELAEIISEENGKTLEESKGDLRRGIEVVDFACGVGQLTKGECLPQIADNIDALTSREPIGVCAGITPFNFPAMIPLWMFPLAIACGNTFILKPSEKTPLTAKRLVELFVETGLPEGVINIVNGGRETVEGFCQHPGIAAVSFVGSSPVAKAVYQMGTANGKRVQAAGGAKNVLLVMPDAEPESTLRAVMGSAYGCAGQRCMAGSILMGMGEGADSLRDNVVDVLSSMKVADTLEHRDADMGPVIDGVAQQRILNTLKEIERGPLSVAYEGQHASPDGGFFVGPTLLDHVTPDSDVFNQEIFGPVLSMVRPKTLEEAIAWMNTIRFGNGATIFTQSGGAARQFVREMQCGMIGVNIGVPAPMALFSFSGWNESFYGDLHVQGTEGVLFYTRQKTVLSRWDKNYVRQQGW